jgi:hypothetical protein
MKPQVTKLIGLLDKPALLKWANKIGLEGVKLEDYRKQSMGSGSSLHSQVEKYITNGIPFENKHHQMWCDVFLNGTEILGIEENIETEYFTGRLDLRFKYMNEIYIIDFKSNQKHIYFENKLQLVAYRMAKQCDKIAIVSIPDFTLLPIEIKDFSPYEEIIKYLSMIYTLKEQLGEN